MKQAWRSSIDQGGGKRWEAGIGSRISQPCFAARQDLVTAFALAPAASRCSPPLKSSHRYDHNRAISFEDWGCGEGKQRRSGKTGCHTGVGFLDERKPGGRKRGPDSLLLLFASKPVRLARSQVARRGQMAKGTWMVEARWAREVVDSPSGKPSREIMPVASEQPHAGAIAACHDAEAVMLNFMQPAPPRWRALGG